MSNYNSSNYNDYFNHPTIMTNYNDQHHNDQLYSDYFNHPQWPTMTRFPHHAPAAYDDEHSALTRNHCQPRTTHRSKQINLYDPQDIPRHWLITTMNHHKSSTIIITINHHQPLLVSRYPGYLLGGAPLAPSHHPTPPVVHQAPVAARLPPCDPTGCDGRLPARPPVVDAVMVTPGSTRSLANW